MPKRISQNDLDIIVKAVSTLPDGGGVAQIHSALERKVTRRTLQRRLALFVEQKRLIVEGRARASRYHLPVITGEEHQRQIFEKQTAHAEFYIPLSLQGEELRKVIRLHGPDRKVQS
ncbi:MAG: hypothetical protein GY702_27380 [Desulfobulbaceae bacterium]|nr:hypothetical protein [Desulfobulbaceae bacterium]